MVVMKAVVVAIVSSGLSLKNMSSSIMRRGSSTSSLTLSPFKGEEEEEAELASFLWWYIPRQNFGRCGSRYTDTFSKPRILLMNKIPPVNSNEKVMVFCVLVVFVNIINYVRLVHFRVVR